MNTLYPVFLKLSEKNCLVVGGGKVALQKIRSLLEAETRLTVISPELVPELEEWATAGRFELRRRRFQPGDLEGFFLVVGATNDRGTNRQIREEALERRVVCNVVDDPELCDFYVPSIHTSGDLKIAISTNAKSPAISKKLRREMAELYGPRAAEALELFHQAREAMKADRAGYEERSRALSALLEDHPLYALEREGEDGIRRLKEALKPWI